MLVGYTLIANQRTTERRAGRLRPNRLGRPAARATRPRSTARQRTGRVDRYQGGGTDMSATDLCGGLASHMTNPVVTVAARRST
jgi:hypothetical protein